LDYLGFYRWNSHPEVWRFDLINLAFARKKPGFTMMKNPTVLGFHLSIQDKSVKSKAKS